MSDRELDLVVFGATGFTGRLVCEYLAQRPPARWAIAGRNRDKLAALGLTAPVLVVDAMDPSACAQLARRAKVVCTTVGPYSKYGSALVAACADAGTHYCDLTGEVFWIRQMIDAHHQRARATGARIVHACGFDSIPSDLGTWAAQQEFIARYGKPAAKVTAFFGPIKGWLSGGTVATGFEIARAAADPAVRRMVRNPHALDPEPDWLHPKAAQRQFGWDRQLQTFFVPFFMAEMNSRVVRRAHALAGFPWGPDFEYLEVMSAKRGVRGLAKAASASAGVAGVQTAMKWSWLRQRLQRRAPQPSEGPSKAKRDSGHWKVRFVAEGGGDRVVYIAADGAADPGYASTAKMLGESALCLALDPLTSSGGVLTPSVAMDGALLTRLRSAGLRFSADDPVQPEPVEGPSTGSG